MISKLKLFEVALDAGMPPHEASYDKASVIDLYIQKQQQLTAVEQFSQEHDQLSEKKQNSDRSLYQSLIPSSLPASNQQYAFEVDLDECSGCKACVTACHNLNGLDENETWRSVGMVHGGNAQSSLLQTVTTACHHCLEPGCLKGCPVQAYEKDPTTGIVKHLDDQCIGCQYCLLMCPYEAPQYSEKRGIVRKCDMCSSRLEQGEAPACVQGCPNGAIKITLANVETIRQSPKTQVDVAGAPDSNHTLPTTRFKSKHVFAEETSPLDNDVVKPEQAHLPLVLMLILTQISVGSFSIGWFLWDSIPATQSFFQPIFYTSALLFGLTGLAASLFHLGRPIYAFRAFLGIKTSWMSREVVSLALFAKLAILATLLSWYQPVQAFIPLPEFSILHMPLLHNGVGLLVVFSGILGVYCSGMIYKSTPRELWASPNTILRFFLTTFVMGVAFTSLLIASYDFWNQTKIYQSGWTTLLPLMLILTTLLKLRLEFSCLLKPLDEISNSLRKTNHLLLNELQQLTFTRLAFGMLGGILLPLIIFITSWESTSFLLIGFFLSFICLFMGELLERTLFFKASVHPKMPGIKN